MWTPIDSQEDLDALNRSLAWDDATLVEFYVTSVLYDDLPSDVSRSGFTQLTMYVLIDTGDAEPSLLELAFLHCDRLALSHVSAGDFVLRGYVDSLKRVELTDRGDQTQVRCARLAFRRLDRDDQTLPFYPSQFAPER
ncbi:MAG: hypothetical protein R3B72_04200 [Polyangiaceae bacterium]